MAERRKDEEEGGEKRKEKKKKPVPKKKKKNAVIKPNVGEGTLLRVVGLLFPPDNLDTAVALTKDDQFVLMKCATL